MPRALAVQTYKAAIQREESTDLERAEFLFNFKSPLINSAIFEKILKSQHFSFLLLK